MAWSDAARAAAAAARAQSGKKQTLGEAVRSDPLLRNAFTAAATHGADSPQVGDAVKQMAQASAALAAGNPKAGAAPIHSGTPYRTRGTAYEGPTPDPLAGAGKRDMNSFVARTILAQTGSRDRDYDTLRSSQTEELADRAKQFGFRKSATSPGSTARAFHGYLHKKLGKA